MPQNITIRKALSDDLCILSTLENDTAENKRFIEVAFKKQREGSLEIYVAEHEEQIAAFCFYNKKPKYAPFLRLGVPEIQGLFVRADLRRRGIARALIEHCEAHALSEGCDLIGISVAVVGTFGAAQRLYISMGYEPDAQGVVYDRQPVSLGETRIIDNELCLMLIKTL